ncbi:UNVERIFIED_CONTAM: AT-hook motif nuclear-localized protein 1 [Sesamum angustifolium]|uniref:AT-hook motif nuclear-localized protein n=1 Tax=Sesamum angustifolium TaxID=2727405 RepID=A0AAW2N464_9LAMI
MMQQTYLISSISFLVGNAALGRFEILTLTGSYTISDNGGIKSRTGGLSVSLASPDGRVIGGGVAGLLMAASPVQSSWELVPNGFKMQKRKQNTEPRASPTIQFAPATVTAAIPISQAAPENHVYPMPTSQLPAQNQGEAENSLSNKDHPNSASTDTSDWNGSGPSSDQRPSPDINISIPFEEH